MMVVFDRGDDVGPVFGGWGSADAVAPRALEDGVQHEHSHVAANAVALVGDAGEGFYHGLAQCGMKSVELQNVRPGGKERVASAGEGDSVDDDKRGRVVAGFVGGAVDEVLGVVGGPRMVGRD